MLCEAELEGLKSRGPLALSPANRGCLRARVWHAAAAPLAPSPSSRLPETRAFPTKTSWARQVLLGVPGKGLQESLGPRRTGLARLAKGAMESSVPEGAP